LGVQVLMGGNDDTDANYLLGYLLHAAKSKGENRIIDPCKK
jgi:hypothetical protein